jgi:pimeloyl-ACP methyl ester carboxylesterase
VTIPDRIAARSYPAPGAAGERILLVMLPGVNMAPQDFVDNGVVAALHERLWPVEAVTAAAAADFYLDGNIVERLDADVVAPALARGHRRLWFLGISLGGMGALLYARAHPGAVEGIILLAPFLGVPGMVAEVARAGGLAHWEPGLIAANDGERRLLAWLKGYTAAPDAYPKLLLGYGKSDRFAAGHVLLAKELPAERVLVGEGGHDWLTWTRLWQELLDRRPFASSIDGSN